VHELFVLFMILLASSVAAAVALGRRGEPWRVWAALGLGMGPLVLAYAVNHRRRSADLTRRPSTDADPLR
jgi:hypothetical protein